MLGCKAACLHRQLVNDYRAERERQEIAAENDWRERDGNEHAAPLITFRLWLESHAGAAAELCGTCGAPGALSYLAGPRCPRHAQAGQPFPYHSTEALEGAA
jgi:hypothetical protein